MADNVASTAIGPLFITAMEYERPISERVVNDPLALHMLPSAMRLIVRATRVGWLRRGMIRMLEASTPGIYGGMVARKRYIQDQLQTAVKNGIDAVVILGAGLDTVAYRLPSLKICRVYEVDLPQNIHHKQERVESLYGAVPEHVSLVPIDFESQRLEAVLLEHGYNEAQRTFFIWEGVTQYLTEAAIQHTFQFLQKAAPGSQLVFTYVLRDFIDGKNTYGLASLYERFRVKDQVWLFGLHPQNVSTFMSSYGWHLLEDVGTETYTMRYIEPIGRADSIANIERAVHAEKAVR